MKTDRESESYIKIEEKDLIRFLEKQGIVVKTNTRAKGHDGIFKLNRIDISTRSPKEKRLSILAHEYAHKIHYDLEKSQFHKGGSIEKLFNTKDIQIHAKELVVITNFVDPNSKFLEFYTKKKEIYDQIKILEKIIKKEYPDFKRSCVFEPINKFFRKNKSPANHLLRYDNIKLLNHQKRSVEHYGIDTLDEDFPEIPHSLRTYIKIKSLEREYKRIYRYKNKREKYYLSPIELFARFVECFFIDKSFAYEFAPQTCKRFFELLDKGYYGRLKELFRITGII